MSGERQSAEKDWIVEASNRALEFLAVLATDDPQAVEDRPRVFDRMMLELDDPAKLHTMLYSLVWLAHCMRTSAAGDDEPGTWTFEIHTPLGLVPVDQAEPEVRWVARWLIACMNGDAGAAADLWFSVPDTEQAAGAVSKALGGPVLAFLSHSVREFLAAGRPLNIPPGAQS